MIAHVRKAKSWRNKLGYIFGPPGWIPTEERQPELTSV